MKKVSLLVSLTLALAMVLAACSSAPATSPAATTAPGGAETPTEATSGQPTATTAAAATAMTTESPAATTAVAATTAPMSTETAGAAATLAPMSTETPMATMAPTSTSTTGGSVLPNTGSTGADRLSHMLQYPVVGQSGQEVAKVADVVVNLGSSMVDYVIIQPNAAMKLGNVFIPVPYSAMTVRAYEGATTEPQGTAMPMATTTAMTGTSSTGSSTTAMATATAGAGMGLNTRNLAFYLNVDDNTLKNAPHFSGLPAVSATSWDQKMSAYWSKTSGGTVTPGTTTTAVPTATTTSSSTKITSTPEAVAGASSVMTATATTTAATKTVANGMKGNILGSALLTYRLNDATTPNVGKVSDAVVDLATGRVMYLMISGGTNLGLGNKVALVPLQVFRNNPGATNFTLMVPTAVLSKAPLFSLNELPDFSTNNWDTQLSSYWQSNMGTK